ncbi:MAG: DNA polymerase IV [Elusimicrobia bacterium]|nr:DNA polymerase IV [Elusimicrobiota bacterium]
MTRTILLIDMNAFFASVEQAMNPALRGKPIIVCGRGRTVVTTASYEARVFGVKTGMNLYQAKQACPQVIAVEGDMSRYIDASHNIQRIAREFTDQVEMFSIDECFLDVSKTCRNEVDPQNIARAIKHTIREKLGVTCSIGIGPNKVVAKIASKMQKPDGLIEIREKDIPVLFALMAVQKLQGVGVGRHISEKLMSMGITTAGQLGNTPLEKLMHHFGIMGYRLKRIGEGKDDSPVDSSGGNELIKSVGHSHTFPRDTRDISIIRSYMMMLTEKVGLRLREYGLMGKTVYCTIRFGDFTSWGAQQGLKEHIRQNREIFFVAEQILARAFPLSKAVRLVGLSISDLKPRDTQQFLLKEMEKDTTLAEAVDDINKKYGVFTIKASSVILSEKFGIRPSCGMVSKQALKIKV